MAEEIEFNGNLKKINDYLDSLTNKIVDSKFMEYAVYRGCMVFVSLFGDVNFDDSNSKKYPCSRHPYKTMDDLLYDLDDPIAEFLFGRSDAFGKKVELPKRQKKLVANSPLEGMAGLVADLMADAPIDITPVVDKFMEYIEDDNSASDRVAVELDKRPKYQIYGLGKLFGGYVPKKKTRPLTKDLDFELSATEKILEYLEENYPRMERMVERIIPDYNTFYKICGIVSPVAHLAVDILEKPFKKLLEFSDKVGIFDKKVRGM